MKNSYDREIFSTSGPIDLTSVEWGSLDHQRSVAAALIQGVYERECKRQRATPKPQSPSSVWCHFQPIELLEDKVDSSIFGAVYESKRLSSNQPKASTLSPPRYVIALRGTLMEHGTLVRDMRINLQFMLCRVTCNSRYTKAAETLRTVLERAGNESVWLCGHSQGAAIALQLGREMAKSGFFIQTFLFSPPYSSLPIEKIKNERVRSGIRFAKSVVNAGINFAMRNGAEEQEQDSYRRLCSWIPLMFVHEKDPFSLEYVGYFEHKEKMAKMGLDGIDRLVNEKSFTSWVSGVFGADAEATHLIPSAYVVKHKCPAEDFRRAHAIAQWWMPLQKWESKLYQTKV